MAIEGEGWYADPQDASRLRWWDGAAWTEHVHDHVTAWHRHPALSPTWRRVSLAVQVGLALNVLAALYTVYVDQQILGLVDDVRLRPDTVSVDDGDRVDRLIVLSLVGLLPLLATGILFMVWMHTAHNSSRMDRSVLRHRTGWTIGGWLVPVLSWWRPFQMVTDLRRGATGTTDPTVTRVQGWWWGTFLAMYATSAVSELRYRSLGATSTEAEATRYLDGFASAAAWERTSSGLAIVSAVLGILLVREVTRLVLADESDQKQFKNATTGLTG